jgi:succinate dehydrogenase/fumarate reductase flavoprotein subunit
MAGLTAAARAVHDGARVLVVEVAEDLGGSVRFAGYAWTAPSRAVIDEILPEGDQELRHALVDHFPEGIEWIRSLGVHVGEAQPILGFGVGHAFDTNQYVETCRRRVLERGEILTSTHTSSLLHDGTRVAGARLRLPDGTIREVRADATVIATGGFQADPELRAALVHPNAADIPLRSNPASRGDGLRLAREVGAATGPDNAGFYGHLVPSGIPFADSGDFVGLSLYYSEHALLFNLGNERFVDESVGDHLTTMALLEQPEARGLLVADARVHRDWIVRAYVAGAESSDKFAVASRRGGRCGVAESLDELALLPEEWGYDGEAIARAVAAFNETVRAGGEPAPGRRLDRLPLDEPPYYVIETIPAITFPFYGIRIDSSARVLDESGEPIPGLLAAGSDTGGLYVRAYAGGIASALVFGLTAAQTAVTELSPRRSTR